jgi:hypothetical protein
MKVAEGYVAMVYAAPPPGAASKATAPQRFRASTGRRV